PLRGHPDEGTRALRGASGRPPSAPATFRDRSAPCRGHSDRSTRSGGEALEPSKGFLRRGAPQFVDRDRAIVRSASGQYTRGEGPHLGWCRAGRTTAAPGDGTAGGRSEEHTSELQSRENLVCRLLLEK